LRSPDPPLSWRDFFLIPAVVLFTLALLVGVSELVCRVLWADYESFACSIGDGNKPNCVMRMKNTEGKEYEYRFNECGFRSTTSCLTKAPGEFRLVTMGTSIGLGLYVSEEDFFATRAAAELSRALDRPVDAQNMGAMVSTLQIPGKIARALALQPDAIVLEICPVDLLIAYEDIQHKAAHQNAAPAQPAQVNLQGRIRDWMRRSRTGFMAQHMLLSDDSFLYQSYQNYGAADDALRVPPSPTYERYYRQLGATFAKIRAQLGDSQVPFFVAILPNRIGAGMLSDRIEIPGRDPAVFGQRVTALARENGLLPVDAAPYFRAVSHAERFYYVVDGHPGPAAHSVLGHAIANAIIQHLRSANALTGNRRDSEPQPIQTPRRYL
jgi:hypothetical protein